MTEKRAKSAYVPLSEVTAVSWWKLSTHKEENNIEKVGDVKFDDLAGLFEASKELYETVQGNFTNLLRKDSEQQWLRKVLTKGTNRDKCTALVTLTQMCPVLSVPHLMRLVQMANKKNRTEALLGVDTLKDLFLGTLFPKDRSYELKAFKDRESDIKGLKSVCAFTALQWYFEDCLKSAFKALCDVVMNLARDSISSMRMKGLRYAFDFLHGGYREQDDLLLSIVFGKLGDVVDRKIASQAQVLLGMLVKTQRNMFPKIVTAAKKILDRDLPAYGQECELKEVQKTAARRSVYYTAAFLADMRVPNREEDCEGVRALLKVYSSSLDSLLTGAEDKKLCGDSQRMSVVKHCLVGVQKALKVLAWYESLSGIPVSPEALKTLTRLASSAPLEALRVSILSFLHHSTSQLKEEDPRFQRVLYEQTSGFDLFECNARGFLLELLHDVITGEGREEKPTEGASKETSMALLRRALQTSGGAADPSIVMGPLKSLSAFRQLVKSKEASMRLAAPTRLADIDDEVEQLVDETEEGEALPTQARRPTGEKLCLEGYMPLGRDPRLASAGAAPLWELVALRNHVVPRVAAMAEGRRLEEDGETHSFGQTGMTELLKKLEEYGHPDANIQSEEFVKSFLEDKTIQAARDRRRQLRSSGEAARGAEGADEEGEEGDARDREVDSFLDNYWGAEGEAADDDELPEGLDAALEGAADEEEDEDDVDFAAMDGLEMDDNDAADLEASDDEELAEGVGGMGMMDLMPMDGGELSEGDMPESEAEEDGKDEKGEKKKKKKALPVFASLEDYEAMIDEGDEVATTAEDDDEEVAPKKRRPAREEGARTQGGAKKRKHQDKTRGEKGPSKKRKELPAAPKKKKLKL